MGLLQVIFLLAEILLDLFVVSIVVRDADQLAELLVLDLELIHGFILHDLILLLLLNCHLHDIIHDFQFLTQLIRGRECIITLLLEDDELLPVGLQESVIPFLFLELKLQLLVLLD